MSQNGLDACLENIENISRKYERLRYCLRVHISEAVRLFGDGMGYVDFLTDADSEVEKYNSIMTEICRDSALPASQISLCFCDALAKTIKMPKNARMLCRLLSSNEETFEQNPLISCMRGNMFDEAYDRFSIALGGARVLYSDGFSAACENVYHSITEFAIIPLENSNEGILSGFASLIDKYELCIVGSTWAENGHDSSLTSYILVAKNLMLLNGKGKIRVSMQMTQEHNPCQFLADVADYFNANILQIHSFSQSDGRNKTLCTYELSDDNPSSLILTLLLNFPGMEIKGIYRAI